MKKIMMVDDEQDQLLTLKTIFNNSDKKYELITANSGMQCLQLLKNEEIPDLIFMDIMMPEMTGWELLNRIKENPRWKNIPIVFLTAKGDEMSIGMGGLASEEYIVKPFNIVELKEKVERILTK